MDRKEIKRAYKESTRPAGVYQVRNLANGKVLLGSTPNLDAIWTRHQFEFDFGGHPNKELLQDWKEQGKESFVFEVLEELETKDEVALTRQQQYRQLKEMEEAWFAKIDPSTLYNPCTK